MAARTKRELNNLMNDRDDSKFFQHEVLDRPRPTSYASDDDSLSTEPSSPVQRPPKKRRGPVPATEPLKQRVSKLETRERIMSAEIAALHQELGRLLPPPPKRVAVVAAFSDNFHPLQEVYVPLSTVTNTRDNYDLTERLIDAFSGGVKIDMHRYVICHLSWNAECPISDSRSFNQGEDHRIIRLIFCPSAILPIEGQDACEICYSRLHRAYDCPGLLAHRRHRLLLEADKV